jgi:MFS family permease
MEKNPRKKILLLSVFAQTLIWPLLIIFANISLLNSVSLNITWILMGIIVFYIIFGGIATPAWFSLMGDVVPDGQRGKYFARRNIIGSSIALSSILLISLALDYFKTIDMVIQGFIIIFCIAFLGRSVSGILFTRHYYPPFKFEKVDHIGVIEFVKELPKNNFGHFTLFVTFLSFAQWIAGPFFSLYMLQDLQFDYTMFTLVNITSSIVALFLFPTLGKISDKYGNVLLLRIGACIIPFLPILWLVFNDPIGLIFGPQLLGGIGWTAFNLAASNFIYDNIPSQKRGEYIAFYNFVVGIGVILGGLCGSAIITWISITFMNPYLFLFLLSGIGRMIAVIIFLPKIKEIRAVKAQPILNMKNQSMHHWLYDLVLREHRTKKSKSVVSNHQSNKKEPE